MRRQVKLSAEGMEHRAPTASDLYAWVVYSGPSVYSSLAGLMSYSR